MGLFGKRKYKPKQISTAYGKAPEFTTVEELPDDLRMLKGMSYYYYNNEIDKNHQYAYYIDRKILEMDKERSYPISLYRMATYYFNGIVVERDNKIGSKYFIEWMDHQLLHGSMWSVSDCVKKYFNFGFRSYQYLVEMADKRIEMDKKNGGEPIGMCMYKTFFLLWKYSSLVQMLGIEQKNASKYLYFLKNNFDIPEVDFIIEVMEDKKEWSAYGYKEEEAYKNVDRVADLGNPWAVYYIMDKWLDKFWEKDKTKDAELAKRKKTYERLCLEYKKMQNTHSHQENIRIKEEFDKELMKYKDFFIGNKCYIPENWPFSKKSSSLYYKMSKLVTSYHKLYQMSRNDNNWRNNPEVKDFQNTLEKYGKILIDENYAPAIFLVLIADANLLTYTTIILNKEDEYKKLVDRNYVPAVKLQTEVNDHTVELALRLRVNSKAIEERAAFHLNKAKYYKDSENWEQALYHLTQVKEYGAEIPEHLKYTILLNALYIALKAFDIRDKNVNYESIFLDAATYFNEPEAYHRLAIIENNENKDYYAAYLYCKNVINYSGYSYITDGPMREGVLQEAKKNLKIAEENIKY